MCAVNDPNALQVNQYNDEIRISFSAMSRSNQVELLLPRRLKWKNKHVRRTL